MVSRGGRSKACSNCRRRRVKCDETRPTCNRCRKLGLDCDGPKDATWIIETGRFSSKPQSCSANQPRTPHRSGLQLVQRSSPIYASLPLSAFEDNIYMSYARQYLLRGGPIELAYEIAEPDMQALASTDNQRLTLLRSALFSLAVTYFGTQNHLEKIMDKGYHLYGLVLQQLNTALSEPQSQTTDETILTIFICMRQEMFPPTGGDQYLKHLRGLETILELRGPPDEDSAKSTLALFQDLRIPSIFAALVMSTPSIYARDDWKQMPCTLTSEADFLRHHLFNLLADCTRLRSIQDSILASGNEEKRITCLQEIRILLNRLKILRDLWAAVNKSHLDASTLASNDRLPISSYTSATDLMLYDATFIFLAGVIAPLEPSTNYHSLQHAAAQEIVECLEFKVFDQQEGRNNSNTIRHAAIKVAWTVLGGLSSPEGRKLASMIKCTSGDVYAFGSWPDEGLELSRG
ncbi:hypothetical protein K469DRAFT_215531 [Zopfia rhizophila CBS 207.26]|uniref:Zn(2)-C6 fungal-type domain-containing protein n=1 Tax=Zopfia rhizophila CBS 207.26 TaxID=1314779 RepID=A0A6A6DUE4_9PEZI|nr:hypothetical protein K469DRAFT_215531 [Zopfia rhizophila CBS 207.26]